MPGSAIDPMWWRPGMLVGLAAQRMRTLSSNDMTRAQNEKRGQEQAPKVDRPARPETPPTPPPPSSGGTGSTN